MSENSKNRLEKGISEKSKDIPDRYKGNDEFNDIDKTEKNFYNALNHDIRRKMIKMIGENGQSSFTAFKRKSSIDFSLLIFCLVACFLKCSIAVKTRILLPLFFIDYLT